MQKDRPHEQPVRILLIEEDQLGNEELFAALAEREHEIVFVARSLEDGLQLSRNLRPDLVFIAIQRSRWTDCAEKAHEIFSQLNIPVVTFCASQAGTPGTGYLATMGHRFLHSPVTPRGVQSVIESALSHRDLRDRLDQSEQRWEHLMSLCRDGVCLVAEQGVVEGNAALAKLLHLREPSDAAGRDLLEFVHEEWRGRARALIGNLLEKRTPVEPHRQIWLRGDGQPLPVEVGGSPTVYGGRKAAYILIREVVETIRMPEGPRSETVNVNSGRAERERTEAALRESEAKYRCLVETARDIIWTVDLSLQFTYVSPSVTELLGYSMDEIMDLSPLDTVSPESRERLVIAFREEVQKELKEGPRHKYTARFEEIEQYHKDGSSRWMELTTTFLRDEEGNPLEILGISRDVTDRKRDQEQISASLREKEVLLREIHHRVKNNLQVMASLLKLQSRHVEDEHAAAQLTDARTRISSMALVHEKLFQSRSLAAIPMDEYLGNLVNEVCGAYGATGGRIAVHREIGNFSLDVDTAIHVGLIVNELVSNCLKHAFPDGRRGAVTISLKYLAEDRIQLIVADNGIGVPRGLDIAEAATFGLRLVSTLVRQFRGEIDIRCVMGTEVRVNLRTKD